MAVNVKMGVDLSDFTNNIKTAQSEIKTLNATIKLADETMKANGESSELMGTKLEALNSKLKAQQTVVEQYVEALKTMSSEGVDPTSQKYQSMATKLLEAQTQVVKTQADIDNLNSSQETAAQSAESLGNSVENIGKKLSLKEVTEAVGKISDGFEKAIKKATQLGKAIVKNVLGAGSWADDLSTEADRWGITPEQLQRMQKTADLIDTDAEAILAARAKLAKNADKDILKQLGVSSDGKSVEDFFWDVGDAILHMDDAFDKEAAAQEIFGRGWRELLPLFEAGREKYEETNASWSVVSDEAIQKLTELDDKYQAIQNDIDTLKMTAMAELAEPLTKLLEALHNVINSEEGQSVIQGVLDAVKDALEWIAENEGVVVGAIGAIAGAFGTLKVAESVLEFVKLVSGLKGLFGGGGGGGGGGDVGTVGGGGILAKIWAGVKGTASAAGGAWALSPLLAFGLGIAPAMFANMADRQKWGAEYDARMAAASRGGENAWFIEQAAAALDARNGRGGDLGLREDLLNGLKSRKNEELAKLISTIGDENWKSLNDFWNNPENFDMTQVDQLLSNITQKFTEADKKLELPADIKSETTAEDIAGQVGTVELKAKLTGFWGTIFGGADGEHANGLPFVPRDNYLALLHKGERVMPAREAASRNFSSNLYVENMHMAGGVSAAALAAEISARNRRLMVGYGA